MKTPGEPGVVHVKPEAVRGTSRYYAFVAGFLVVLLAAWAFAPGLLRLSCDAFGRLSFLYRGFLAVVFHLSFSRRSGGGGCSSRRRGSGGSLGSESHGRQTHCSGNNQS